MENTEYPLSELESTLAVEITATYAEAQVKIENAKVGIEEALEEMANCGALLESAKDKIGGRYTQWLIHVVKIDPNQAAKCLHIHRERGKAITKRLLQKANILELSNDEPQHEQRTPDPFAWCRWVPKIREALSDEEIGRMGDDQREVARNTLKPMVELYERLGS